MRLRRLVVLTCGVATVSAVVFAPAILVAQAKIAGAMTQAASTFLASLAGAASQSSDDF